MARTICIERKKDFHKEGGKIVDEIMGKEFIDYDKLTIAKAQELAEVREISLDIDGKAKNKATLIQNLKDTH